MESTIIGQYGNDVAANQVLDAVALAAARDGRADIYFVPIPGGNMNVTDESFAQLAVCDVVLFGISSGDAAGTEARVAAEILRRNPGLKGRVVFLEDFPGSSGWKDVAALDIGSKSVLCSILPLPTSAPERSVYGQVHAVGFPDHWIPSMLSIFEGVGMRHCGKLIKKRRGSEETAPIKDEVVLYLSGFKNPAMEEKIIRKLLTMSTLGGKPVLIHFRPHPGENGKPELADSIASRDALLNGQWEIANPEILNAGRRTDPLLIGAADIVVAHPGATSTFWAAGTKTKMICVMDVVTAAEQADEYDYRAAGRFAHLVETAANLPAAVTELMNDTSLASIELRKRQEANTITFSESAYGQKVLAIIRQL